MLAKENRNIRKIVETRNVPSQNLKDRQIMEGKPQDYDKYMLLEIVLNNSSNFRTVYFLKAT